MPKSWYEIRAKADDSADISIFDEIGLWGVSARDFIADLRAITASRITLSINSPGGSVFDGLAMYNALRQSGKTITVRVLGVAASAASLVAMAGDKIVMPANAFMMVHNPMGGVFGNADEMREWADVLDKIAASLIGTYVARTGQSEDEIKALLDAETWLSAAEALELGFADEVEPELRIAARYDAEQLPERVRAGIAPPAETEPPPDPNDTFAARVNALACAAGMGEFVAAWLLDAAIQEDAQAAAAIAEACEVRDLCAHAGVPAEAALHIRARRPLAEVRTLLINARADAADRLHTDGHPPSNGQPSRTATPAAFKPADVWASRRNTIH